MPALVERPIELRTTLQKVRVPSFVVGNDGDVTWQNDAAREQFGDLEGLAFSRIMAGEQIDLVRRQLDLSGSAADYATEVVTRDGRRRSAEVSSVAIEGGDHCHAVFGIVLVGGPKGSPSSSHALTARQSEVLALIADGASTTQIAQSLHLTQETVRNHVRHIFRRLGVHSRVEAVAVAYRDGLV